MLPKIIREATIEKEYYIKNQDETYTKQTREEDASLRLVINEALVGLTVGGLPIQTYDPYFVKIFAQIDAEERPSARVAHLGGGMGWLAKMLLGYGYEQDIYEIDADIAAFLESGILGDKVRMIVGDWKQMLTGKYDIIIYDIDEPLVDDKKLKTHLNEGGKLYTLTD